MNTSFSLVCVGAVLSTMVMLPLPTCLLPAHSYLAPTPDDGVEMVAFMPGSILAQGDHSANDWKSFTVANTTSAGASIFVERCTWYVSGRVATTIAKTATNARIPSSAFFSMRPVYHHPARDATVPYDALTNA